MHALPKFRAALVNPLDARGDIDTSALSHHPAPFIRLSRRVLRYYSILS